MGKIAIEPERLVAVLDHAGAPTSFGDIHLSQAFFHDAVTHAREIRNRYTFLDLAAEARLLDPATLV